MRGAVARIRDWWRGFGWDREAFPVLIRIPTMPFKANAARRHHIPKQKRKVTNWAAYDASLRQGGSLTIWFTDEAIAAWRAAPQTTRGGQPWYPSRSAPDGRVDRLDHRPSRSYPGGSRPLHPQPTSRDTGRAAAASSIDIGAEPVHLLVDSTGLRLCGAGEWLLEKHATGCGFPARRSGDRE